LLSRGGGPLASTRIERRQIEAEGIDNIHAKNDIDSRYGRFRPEFLIKAVVAAEAMLRELDRLSGGALFRNGPAEGDENWLLRQVSAKPAKNRFAGQGLNQTRVLPARASADGLPRDEPDFDALKAGKTVEIGGIRGCFRQTSAKSFCRLDDIFEQTLGDVIQASGSEVLRFVPDEAASLVSSPILFVQDQRHLIES
jgi:hypothetical protein